jgi:hypothetical protein
MKPVALLFAVGACGGHAATASLAVTSPAFGSGGEIPTVNTCEGPDQQPALQWAGAPPQTRAYAVIVDDPDAPAKTWVHLVAMTTATSLGEGTTYGTNDFGKAAWGGPCPPSGRHHYHFKVYALDAAVGTPGITKDDLLAQMQGHVLAQGELVGTYQKTH